MVEQEPWGRNPGGVSTTTPCTRAGLGQGGFGKWDRAWWLPSGTHSPRIFGGDGGKRPLLPKSCCEKRTGEETPCWLPSPFQPSSGQIPAPLPPVWVLVNVPRCRKPGVYSCLKPRLRVAWPGNKQPAFCWLYSIKFPLNPGKWVFKIGFKGLQGLHIFSQAFLFICPLIVIHSTYDVWLEPNIWLSSHLLLTHCSTKGLR